MITDAGAALVGDALPKVTAAENHALRALDADERRKLVRLLTLATSSPST